MTAKALFYFGDFIAIPLAVIALTSASATQFSLSTCMLWLTAFMAGAFVWTAVEYCVHRFIYHRVPIFKALHDAHHDDPGALLGFPAFASSGIIIAAGYFPLRAVNAILAAGFTSGLLAGYAIYMLVHHAVHHFEIKPGGLLYPARLRHMAHHYREPPGDFGVSTGLWDWVFSTQSPRASRVARA